jgi:hypothetical protein
MRTATTAELAARIADRQEQIEALKSALENDKAELAGVKIRPCYLRHFHRKTGVPNFAGFGMLGLASGLLGLVTERALVSELGINSPLGSPSCLRELSTDRLGQEAQITDSGS